MKRFLKNSIVFLGILFSPVIAAELYIRILPNAYKVKATYIKKAAPEIEVMFLGSSHVQNAVNPEYIDFNSANMAYGLQDVQLDSAILLRYIDRMNKLKLVVLEIDYHTMELRNKSDYFRYPWYAIYHNIDLGDYPFWKKYVLYASTPQYFNNYIKTRLSSGAKDFSFNKYGFFNYNSGVFDELAYDEEKIKNTAQSRLEARHTNRSEKTFFKNKITIEGIIKECKKRGVKVAVLTTPSYDTYYNRMILEKNNKRIEFINSLEERGVVFWNYQDFDSLKVKDFKDDDHLSASGSRKFSEEVNRRVKEYIES